MPERVIEYPSVYDVADELRDRISEWEADNLGPDGIHQWEYEAELSVAPGTKVGGYLDWIQFPWAPVCPCGRIMQHLLTIATVEWNGVGDRRWTPVEDQELLTSVPGGFDEKDGNLKPIWPALWCPTGLSLGDGGHMHLFVCRDCGQWPIVPGIECS
jgi:hypothetical protein